MSLENLLRIGKLKALVADEREIARLLESAERALARVQVLEAYRKARNHADYQGIPVSDATARECVDDARRLIAEARRSGVGS